VRLFSSIPLLRIVPDDTKFDFMRFRRISFPVSALLSIVAIYLFFHPGLNLGIDFRGGTLMEIQQKSGTADLAKMRATLSALNLGEIQLHSEFLKTKADRWEELQHFVIPMHVIPER